MWLVNICPACDCASSFLLVQACAIHRFLIIDAFRHVSAIHVLLTSCPVPEFLGACSSPCVVSHFQRFGCSQHQNRSTSQDQPREGISDAPGFLLDVNANSVRSTASDGVLAKTSSFFPSRVLKCSLETLPKRHFMRIGRRGNAHHSDKQRWMRHKGTVE